MYLCPVLCLYSRQKLFTLLYMLSLKHNLLTWCTLFVLAPIGRTVMGQNPIVRDQFTADPTARVFNGKVYLYPSHDIPAPAGQRQDWFCMADYHVFSSENLTEWTDHGVIVTQAEVPWGKADGYSMWAPDCVCKDGRYYFYFPDAPRQGRGFAVGVATADQPEGPFTCEPEPIAGVTGIDPCVLVDDDGQAYIYWAGGPMRGARLHADMKHLDGGVQEMQGLPDGFKEGPFAFKHGGHYYLTFPWVRHEGGTETLAYAMSDKPLGPWQFKGIIMKEHPNRCWTNHHSIVEYRGQWLLFYHHNDYSPHFDKLRSAHIDRLFFNADGTIREVVPTLRGVGVNAATQRIEVDRYSSCSTGVTYAYNDSADTFRGWHAVLPQAGSWITYADVDFGNLRQLNTQRALRAKDVGGVYLVANVRAMADAQLVVRQTNAKGRVIARLPIKVQQEGGRHRDMRGQWVALTAQLESVPEGVGNLCVVAEGAGISVDWLQFKVREPYFSPVAAKAAPATPDSEGFIRRWLVLEPIAKPNPSNTVFTDSYLNEAFATPPFAVDQRSMPKDGQKVKVGGRWLAWHAVESERHNVKLFRFADLLGMQPYGVLFWAATVIMCDEDIPDVRLAAGSNGASKWWLNGEEILLLSGDRRMVRDDGASARVSLRRGRNVLHCAVINGPGMSDFCARFIDKQGKPVVGVRIGEE